MSDESTWWRRGADVIACLPNWMYVYGLLERGQVDFSDIFFVDCLLEQVWADEHHLGFNK